MIRLSVILFCLFLCQTGFGQPDVSEMKRRMFGDVQADSFMADLKMNHVHEVKKITNQRKNVMTMRLDTAGRISSFQQEHNSVVDSITYDDKDRETAHYQIGKSGLADVYTVYEYTDAGLPVVYSIHGAEKKKLMWYSSSRVRDTAAMTTYYESGKTTITKTYKKGGIGYADYSDYDEANELVRKKIIYNIFSKVNQNDTFHEVVLESGEIDFQSTMIEELMNISQTMVADMNKGTFDTAKAIDVYTLGNKKILDKEALSIISRRFPQILSARGTKKPISFYQYDGKRNDRLKMKCRDDNVCTEYSYNAHDRIIAITESGGPMTSVKYIYNANGLLEQLVYPANAAAGQLFEYIFY